MFLMPFITPWTEVHLRIQDAIEEEGRLNFHLNLRIDHTNGECTPLWYQLPQIFENPNEYKPGIRAPFFRMPEFCTTWFSFVQNNLRELESDYVSTRIHDWIDLIFGYGLDPSHVVKRMNTNLKCELGTSPQFMQIIREPLNQRKFGRTVIEKDQIKVSNSVMVHTHNLLFYRGSTPCLISRDGAHKLSYKAKKMVPQLDNLKESSNMKVASQFSLFAFFDDNIFISWQPSLCRLVKTEIRFFSNQETLGKIDDFSLTRKIYNHENELLVIRSLDFFSCEE